VNRYRPLTHVAMTTLQAFVALAWSVTVAGAYAGVQAARHGSDHALALDPLLVLLSVVISTLSGATALAWRINDLMLKEDARLRVEGGERRPFVRPWLFAGAHMGGSWMAGTLAFIAGRINQWDVWTVLATVLVASFVGAKWVEREAEKRLGVVIPDPTVVRPAS